MISFKEYLDEKRNDSEDENMLFGPGSPVDMLIHAHMLGKDISGEMSQMIRDGKNNHSDEMLNEKVTNVKLSSMLDEKDTQWHERHESPDGYGKSSGAGLDLKSSAQNAGDAVAAHYAKSPEAQSSSLEAAAKRLGHVQYNVKNMSASDFVKRLASDSGNKKTGMNVNNPLVNRRLSNGTPAQVHNNYGFGGNPVEFRQKTSSTDQSDGKKVAKCPHMTADCGVGHKTVDKNGQESRIGASCLAQSGGYKFGATLAKLSSNDRSRFGASTNPDHAILMAHMIKTKAQEASSIGKVNDHRFQVSDQGGAHGEAVAKAVVDANPGLKDTIHMYDYNKDHSQVLHNLRLKQAGKYNMSGSFSHNGPSYFMNSSGGRQINAANMKNHGSFYTALSTAEHEGLDHHTYLVRGGRSMHPDGKVFSDNETGYAHKQPKSNASQAQKDAYISTDAAHTATRYYATQPSHGIRHLKDHEPDESFDEKSGQGHVSIKQNDKLGISRRVKIPFIQHQNNEVAGHGKVGPNERSDGAAGGIGHSKSQASSAVASGSAKAITGEVSNSLMHQTHDDTVLDRNTGILHVANPHVLSSLGHHYETSVLKSQ